MTISRSAKISR